MSQPSLLIVFVALIVAKSSLGEEQSPFSDVIQFVGTNRTARVAHSRNRLTDEPDLCTSRLIYRTVLCFKGKNVSHRSSSALRCDATCVTRPKMTVSASVKTSRVEFLSPYAFLQGSKADRHLVEKSLMWAFRIFKSARSERVGKLLADRSDDIFMSTFGELDVDASMQVNDSTLSSTSSCSFAASVVFAFLLFVIVIVAHRKDRRSTQLRHGCLINFACSSSKSTVSWPIVAPIKCFRFLVVVAFVMAVIVPSTESAAANDYTYGCKDCGGNNWYCFRSSCLYISTSTPLTWSEAADLCSRDGASLLSIVSVTEDKTIAALIENVIGNLYESESFFFGLLRAPAAETGVDRYRWADGSPLSYARWTSLNAFKGVALCGTLLFTRLNGSSSVRWNADSCSSRHKFICKRPRQLTLRDGDVRLVDDVLPTRGRLEIYFDGSWKGVCLRKDIYSSSQTAAAACRQMSYDGLLEASSRIGEGAVVSQDIYCTENDVFVRSCTMREATCYEHLSVSCRSGSIQSLGVRLVNSSAQLVNSSVSIERSMEVGVGKVWKRACIDHDIHDQQSLDRSAENVCRRMGYGEGKWQSHDVLPPGVRLPFCRSTLCNSENCFSLQENGVAEYHVYNKLFLIRSSIYDLEIKCGILEWDIRLINGVGGTKGSKGRVDVYLNATWSVVCDSEWTWNASNVVCRQFGFERAISTEWHVHKNSNDTMIHVYISGTRCKGTETAFKDCDFRRVEGQSNESCHVPVVVCEERKYCPIGWFLYSGYCYALSNQSSEFSFDHWDLVERHCGRSLLSISSPHEHAFVMSLLAEVESKGESIGEDVWIGLERGNDDQYKWINDDSFSYAMWARGEPGLNDLYNCVAMDSRTGYWKTADCTSSKKVVCKIALVDLDNKVRQVAAPTFDNRCFKDEVHYNNACFHLSKKESESVAQDRADLECQKRGAQLVSFRSLSEHYFIAKESSGLKGFAYWIGLVYNNTTDSFTWLDGTAAVFSMWAKYEPAYEKGECVTFGFDGLRFGWSVEKCSTKVGYVCKRTFNRTTEIDIAATEKPQGYVLMCPSGWTKLGQQLCFRRNDDLQTWHKSLSVCEGWRKGGSLATITSSLHQTSRLSEVSAWIGLNDIDGEGVYNWTDGSPYFYAKWSSSEIAKKQKDRETHDCVAATTSAWNTLDCFGTLPSVCSMPAILDLDECVNKSDNCSVDASCVNTPGSFECVCNPGFSGNGTTCYDYSVCSECDAISQTCVLRGGSYRCECNSGWLPNGSLCSNINECDSCQLCDPNAVCTDTPGSFFCECLTGWTGDGFTCTDIDECLNSSLCSKYANCTNTNGSYECTCDIGYKGNGTYCALDEGSVTISDSSNVVVIISTTLSFVLFLLIIVVIVALYIRRKRRHLSKAFVDEWEISRGDVLLLDKIGEGFFGVVRKGYLYQAESKNTFQSELKCGDNDDENKTLVACKMLKDRYLQHDEIDLLEEIRLMKRIGRHPHIVSMLGCVTVSQPPFLVVEFCCNGDLLCFLQKMRQERVNADNVEQNKHEEGSLLESLHSRHEIEQNDYEEGENKKDDDVEESEANVEENDRIEDVDEESKEAVLSDLTASDLLSFAWQIASGMEYLAGKDLVHRDLACRNVLVSENKLLKVSDFGLTRAVYEDGAYNQKTARRLPFRWMSIEAIIHRLFSEKSDVWSFGVVLWEIVTLGCFPYPCLASKDLLLHLRSGKRLECPENVSKVLFEIMSECWRSEPDARPTFQDLCQRLGKMLEEETSNQYLNLDVIYLSSFVDFKSVCTGESVSSEKTEDDLGTRDDATDERADVRQRNVLSKEVSV